MIEFQKCGLPHAYMLVFLHPDDKHADPSHINKIISIEIQNKIEDPERYFVVQTYMMHGPCGKSKSSSPFMVDNRCIKYFSKIYNN